MAFPKKIIWSPTATKDIENITAYLLSEWGKRIVLKFLLKIDYNISQILLNPKQYPLINKKLKIRRCVITKQNTLYYRIRDDKIEIVRIYDTR